MAILSRKITRRLVISTLLLALFYLLTRDSLSTNTSVATQDAVGVHPLDLVTRKQSDLSHMTDLGEIAAMDLMLVDLEDEVPNLPVRYLQQHRDQARTRSSCAPLPRIYRLEFTNVYWQTLFFGGIQVQMFSAYYDGRMLDVSSPVVRILAMINRSSISVKFHCQFWLQDEHTPIAVIVWEVKLIWHKKWPTGEANEYHPYLITCPCPGCEKVPQAVSLVTKPCDEASNLLKVVYQPSTLKQDFVVCVKGLDYLYTDNSLRLVEWIELLSVLGADMIFLYQLHVHPNMSRVMKWYETQGRVKVIPLTLPGSQPNHPILQHLYLQNNKVRKRLNEVLTFNDCFYRNFNDFKYVVVLDVDEVIMPVNNILNWKELIHRVKQLSEVDNITYSSFQASHVYFFDENLNPSLAQGIPNYLFMLQHVYRAKNFTEPTKFVKSFFDTERVIELHNHYPLNCKSNKHCWYDIPTELGQLNHYRKDCEKSVRSDCNKYKNNSVVDTNIWKYKEDILERTSFVAKSLRLVIPES